MQPTSAPFSYDHAIGTLLTACDNLIAAMESRISTQAAQAYIEEARDLMTRVDLSGWQRVGKVYSYSEVVDAPSK